MFGKVARCTISAKMIRGIVLFTCETFDRRRHWPISASKCLRFGVTFIVGPVDLEIVRIFCHAEEDHNRSSKSVDVGETFVDDLVNVFPSATDALLKISCFLSLSYLWRVGLVEFASWCFWIYFAHHKENSEIADGAFGSPYFNVKRLIFITVYFYYVFLLFLFHV